MPVVAALVLTCAIADARAQELYVIGGWQTNRREPGWKPSPQTPSQPPPSSVQSVAMGAGVWLSPDVGVEGSFGVYRAQSIAWHYSYMSAADELTDDRELPLIGLIRIAPMWRRRVSLEPVLGGGLSLHRATTVMTADCGDSYTTKGCVPITPPMSTDVFTSHDWLVAFGADVAVRVSPRFSIVPGARFTAARRQLYLTSFRYYRGPYSGGGFMWGIGVSGRYRIH